MYESDSYSSEKENQLSKRECFHIIDKIETFKKRLSEHFSDKVEINISFTGGDPLLHNDFFEILQYARKATDHIGILGNSYHVDLPVARKLYDLGVEKYQISVDGLEKTHDKWRKAGSFRDAFRALKILKEAGIQENIMMSISPENACELIPLIDYAVEKKIRAFAFARIARFGNAKQSITGFKPLEYRKILLDYVTHKLCLAKKGKLISLKFKDHLIKLLLYEMGIWKPDAETDGCHMINRHMTILSDGTMYACRRFPYVIGHAVKDDLFEIYSGKRARQYMDFNNYKKCRDCELRDYCRGCPAVACGETGSPFNADPQCWR